MTIKSRNRKTHTKDIRRGLSLYKTDSSPFWFVRIWVSGEKKYVVRSTKETSRVIAAEVAEEILSDLKQKKFVDGVPREQQFQHFADLMVKNQRRLSGKGKNARFSEDDERKLNRKHDGILEHFGNRNVSSISTSAIREYLNLLDDRRDNPLAASTKNKHIFVIRKVLKYAYEDGLLATLPISPTLPSKDNPRVSFSEVEYKTLLKTAREVAKEGISVRGVPLTMEMYYFIVFMVHTFLRPTETEVFAIKHKDIEVAESPKCLAIKVQGKTGFRISSSTQDAPDFYKHIINLNPDITDNDYVFFPSYRNRQSAFRNVNRQFNHILTQANLKTTKDGEIRTAYALRHYSLQTRLRKSGGKVNIYLLAKNAGTSVDQLERFYLNKMEMTAEERLNLQISG